MKKIMSWFGIAAIICVILMAAGNVMKQSRGARQIEGVQSYMEKRYPGEQFTYSGAQVGGRGAYCIVSPVGEPDASFRVFAGNGTGTEAFEDTYYTLTLRDEARTEAERLVRKVFPSACVLVKVYQLNENEVLPPYPTMKAYFSKAGANIDLRVVVDDAEAALFTQANFDLALQELSASFVSEKVVFSLGKPGKLNEISGLSYDKAESKRKDLFAQNVELRIQ